MLSINLGAGIATLNQDIWSQTVQQEVRLSAYPLALWLASSWWRLGWEPVPITPFPTHSWRMAHELPAAGDGYVWPQLIFASDGDKIQILSIQSEAESRDPVHYLSDLLVTIDADTFERGIDDFINSTLARLNATKIAETQLHGLWEEIREERKNPALSAQRRIEAMIGFDPDEFPDGVLGQFEKLIPEAGVSAVTEIAPVCATNDPAGTLKTIIESTAASGIDGRINDRLKPESLPVENGMPAWERGWKLAKQARNRLGLDGEPISDDMLCDLLGLPSDSMKNTKDSSPRKLIGIAIRGEDPSALRFFPRKPRKTGRRFEFARILSKMRLLILKSHLLLFRPNL